MLFENCQGMRFRLLDEVSTFSTMLVHLLDGNLRRACKRHPYARRGDGSVRTVGGLNLILCGDFWQLPPVRTVSLFSNPYNRDLTAADQDILQMFWQKRRNAFTETFVLKKAMRTKDPWMQEVLHAQRHGKETWEMYCFIHGLPTLHTGSWSPSARKPLCGNSVCVELPHKWRSMLSNTVLRQENDSWQLRRSMECAECQRERCRRCWAPDSLDEGNHIKRYEEDRFLDAPYVHPFKCS